ncbi:MAG: exostosin family protein [Candidatus Omnitrophota bacterium]|nr:MAG: exostosin family protein [Candidatus Omnitrophota bacterium]
MKIFILPINKQFQPQSQPAKYPPHNKDYGVEQDFHRYVLSHREIVTNDPHEGDWHYLPIYWTRWALQNNRDRSHRLLPKLQEEVFKSILDDAKTFTVCQLDLGPEVDLGRAVVFYASRHIKTGLDVPLLCSPHRKPFFKLPKQYFACFNGNLHTHPIREDMADRLKRYGDILIGKDMKTKQFVRNIMVSYIALCPRGFGGGSFRFFEAMQLGSVPYLIGDIDIRPFKKFINWDEISFYSRTIAEVEEKLHSWREKKDNLLLMGERALNCFKDHLAYGKWPKYAIQELESITPERMKEPVPQPPDTVLRKIVEERKVRVGVIVNVGFGNEVENMLENTSINRLYGVGRNNREGATNQRLLRFGDRYRDIRNHSIDASIDTSEGVDFILINGVLSHNNFCDTLSRWYPKVRAGGIVTGYNYNPRYYKVVYQAVNEFVERLRCQFHYEGGQRDLWWIKKLF